MASDGLLRKLAGHHRRDPIDQTSACDVGMSEPIQEVAVADDFNLGHWYAKRLATTACALS